MPALGLRTTKPEKSVFGYSRKNVKSGAIRCGARTGLLSEMASFDDILDD
jgi:hypothetical protein